MQILPFNSFMLWAILFAIKMLYSLHSFCIFEHVFCFFVCTFVFVFSPSLFLFFSFFCSVKLPEKQFYSMNIKSLLEDSINLFHYLQHVCVFYEHCQGVCVCVSLWACPFNYRPPITKYASRYCQGFSKTATAVCVWCAWSRPSIREAQQLQVHLRANCANVKHNCIFQ